MHIVVQKQINHDQRLSCLYEDKFPQHIFVVTVTVYEAQLELFNYNLSVLIQQLIGN